MILYKENCIIYLKAAAAAAAAAKSLQSCPTLHDPIDSSPPGSPVPGILQARTLEWVVIGIIDTLISYLSMITQKTSDKKNN